MSEQQLVTWVNVAVWLAHSAVLFLCVVLSGRP